jgi:hypothetical protein
MITGRSRFNLYLPLALAAALACGCQTHKNDPDKRLATFRVHLEARGESGERTVTVQILQAKPVPVVLEKEPFLTEANVAEARVVDVVGGYDLQVRLERQGTWLLQNYSATNPGRHFAVFTQFGDKGRKSRWLAAPMFKRVNSTGVLQFAPDVTREEAEEIALGLNNVAKEAKKKNKW